MEVNTQEINDSIQNVSDKVKDMVGASIEVAVAVVATIAAVKVFTDLIR